MAAHCHCGVADSGRARAQHAMHLCDCDGVYLGHAACQGPSVRTLIMSILKVFSRDSSLV